MDDLSEPRAADFVPVARPVRLGSQTETPAAAIGRRPSSAHDGMLLLDTTTREALIDVAWVVGLVIAAQLAIEIGFGVSIGLPFGPPEDAGEATVTALRKTLLLPTLTMTAGASLTVIALMIRRRRHSAATVGLHRQRLAANLLVGLAATVLFIGSSIAAMIALQFVWPQLIEQMEENTRAIVDVFPNVAPTGFVLVSLMIGFYEEVVFRGFLMTRLRRATGSWAVAVVITTVVFVALHGMVQKPVALAAIACLSLLLCGLTIWRRSLIPAIVVHSMFDLIQFLQLYFVLGDAWS